MSADTVPMAHHEPDAALLLVYPDARRLKTLPDGRVEGLSSMERLLMAALRVLGDRSRQAHPR